MKTKVRFRKFTSKVYIRMGAVFCFCFLVVANTTEIVLWYQFCVSILCLRLACIM